MPRTRARCRTFALAAALATCCFTANAQSASTSNPTAASNPTAGWILHKDPGGYQVTLPPGWSTDTAKDFRLVFHNADRSVFAVALPVPQVNGGAAKDWIQPLVQHYSGLLPNARIEDTQQLSEQPDVAVARVSFDDNGKPGRATVLFQTANGQGVMYAIAAPANLFAAKKPALLTILQSVKPYSAGGAQPAQKGGTGSAGDITWVKWTDPNEQAFTIEVPKGWKVTGGMYHAGILDLRSEVDIASPDHRMQFQLGDANIPGFVPKSRLTAAIPEWSNISDAAGAKYLVHFMEGTEFAQDYLEKTVRQQHPDVQMGQPKERPDFEELAYKLTPKVLQTKQSVGEIDFKYTANGEEMHGACIVRTELIAPNTMGSYWLAHPSLFVVRAGLDEQSKAIIEHIMKSTKFSPAWADKVNAAATAYARESTRNFQENMRRSQEQFQKFSSQMDDMHRRFTNILTDQTDVVSPGGGTTSVSGHYQYYFHSGSTVVGNDSGNVPVNFEPLKKLP